MGAGGAGPRLGQGGTLLPTPAKDKAAPASVANMFPEVRVAPSALAPAPGLPSRLESELDEQIIYSDPQQGFNEPTPALGFLGRPGSFLGVAASERQDGLIEV